MRKTLVRQLIQSIGEDPDREGLLETPARVSKAWDEFFSGYKANLIEVFKTFDPEGHGPGELVLLRNIEFYSMCVVGSTLVETPYGRMPINRLQDGDWIYSFDEEKGVFVVDRCFSPRVTRTNSELVRVYCDKDSLFCTPDHLILTYERGWVEAQELKCGERVVALNRGCIIEGNKVRPYINYGATSAQVAEHKLIYESIHGPVARGMHIHHIDHNSANNHPDNLCHLSRTQHVQHHAQVDGRGKREAQKRSELTGSAKEEYDARRRAGLEKVHQDPIRRQEMLEKRSASMRESWRLRKEGANHKVLSVTKVPWKEDVWCLSAPRHHNFIANGIVVHNCEHHMVPFHGKAHIAYIPGEKVIGISKLARLLDIFAKRLQIQERIGQQVTSALMEHLQPKGAACILIAKHLCISSRGVQKQHSEMVTSSLTGCFLEEPSARSELMQLIQM